MRNRVIPNRAFTIIELLVVVSIIAMLVGILVPAIGKARDQAKLTRSQANLRNLAMAHQRYAAAWNDRQVTFCDDNLSTYGGPGDWFVEYVGSHGGDMDQHHHRHPPLYLGRGLAPSSGRYRLLYIPCNYEANASNVLPLKFQGNWQYFGSFRWPNASRCGRATA